MIRCWKFFAYKLWIIKRKAGGQECREERVNQDPSRMGRNGGVWHRISAPKNNGESCFLSWGFLCSNCQSSGQCAAGMGGPLVHFSPDVFIALANGVPRKRFWQGGDGNIFLLEAGWEGESRAERAWACVSLGGEWQWATQKAKGDQEGSVCLELQTPSTFVVSMLRRGVVWIKVGIDHSS